jgi:PAS domain S-box-containing protein
MKTPEAGIERAIPRPRAAWRGYLLAWLALAACLLLVLLYWRNAEQRERRVAEAEFVAETDAMSELLRQRLVNHELIMRGGVSLFASVARPSAEQWKDYVTSLNIAGHFPELMGLGYAPSLDSSELQALQVAIHDRTGALFTVHPAGVREQYAPVFYLEPRTSVNLGVVGYDMYSSPVRQAAMDVARDTGTTQLSAPLRLSQDADGSTASLLMYSPIYHSRPSASVAARRAAFDGWVCLPLRMQSFVQAALRAAGARHATLSIYDVAAGTPELLYAEAEQGKAVPSLFRRSILLDLYGRRWQLDFASEAGAGFAIRSPELRTTLTVGVIASLLLFGIALALARTESLAQAKAARMSESYRRSELRFRNALRYSTVGKALLDRKGAIVEANPALAAVIDDAPEALIGKPFGHFFVDGLDEPTRSREMQAISEGVHRTTRQLRRPDGEVRHVQLVYTPVPGEIGQDVAHLVQVEDITERLRAEARIQSLNRSLESRVALRTRELTQANHELESFAYSVSHDLRTPLRTIEGFGRLLNEHHGDTLGEDGRDHLARVRKAAGRMDELIDALLRMSRVSRGPLERVPLDLGALASEAVDELRRQHPQRRVDVAIDAGMQALGDVALLRTLLQNLIGNAWKFTRGRDDAWIRVGSMQGKDGEREFFVRDNGAGFDPAYADKLFRPFQRLHSQEEFAGHGIGLASVKRVIERHGGSLRAEGRPGQGASFFFTLPHDDAEDA